MPTRAVLGYPYEGAFYWLLSAEGWRQAELKTALSETHPYYRTLYGETPHQLVDEVASICLLYDEIYLTPADIWLPDLQAKQTGGLYHHEDIGLLTDWSWLGNRDKLEIDTASAQTDLVVRHCLRNVPARNQAQIIRGSIAQISIRDRFDADFVASRSHRRLVDRLRKILGIPESGPPNPSKHIPAALSAVFELASVRFSLASLDEFVALRSERQLKQYAITFREVLNRLPEGIAMESALYQTMLDAMNGESIRGKITGALSLGATLFGAASLIPFDPHAAMTLSAAGVGADVLSKVTSKLKNTKHWWEFAPEVSTALTKTRLRKQCELLKGERK